MRAVHVMLGILVGATGCASGEGKVSVLLTDAPGDFTAVPITISAVEAHQTGSDDAAEDDEEGDGEGGGGWITLAEGEQTHDLLELQNGVTSALGDNGVPAGTYTQIRLIVTEAHVEVDGATHELIIPSADQTGFKLSHRFVVEDGVTYSLVLDFDAQESIHENGGGYQLQPVITVKSFEPAAE